MCYRLLRLSIQNSPTASPHPRLCPFQYRLPPSLTQGLKTNQKNHLFPSFPPTIIKLSFSRSPSNIQATKSLTQVSVGTSSPKPWLLTSTLLQDFLQPTRLQTGLCHTPPGTAHLTHTLPLLSPTTPCLGPQVLLFSLPKAVTCNLVTDSTLSSNTRFSIP